VIAQSANQKKVSHEFMIKLLFTQLLELIYEHIFFNANKDLDTSKARLRAVHKGVY